MASLTGTRQDKKEAYLKAQGFTGTIHDMFVSFYQRLTGSTSFGLQDLMRIYLEKLGYSGTVMDMYIKAMQLTTGSSSFDLSDLEELLYSDTSNLLGFPPSITFYDRFDLPNPSINANYSLGSSTGTFTASRGDSNPATYQVGSTGVVTTTTSSNIPRFTSGYWDTTGFVLRPGIIIESANTNLVPASSAMDDASWTPSNITVSANTTDLVSPDGTNNADILTASSGNGTILLTSAVSGATYSVFLRRKTGTGHLDITADGGTTWVTQTIYSDKWVRVNVSAALASQKCGIRIVTSGDAIYVWGNQFENITNRSSTYIPTTTGPLTRNAEILSYVNSGNRNATAETIFFKFTTFWDAANNVNNSRLLSSDTKDRLIRFDAASDKFLVAPNATDNSTSGANESSATTTAYVSKVVAGIAIQETGNPNSAFYTNSIAQSGGNQNADWTAPAWGTNFYIGNTSGGTLGIYGIIQSITVYSNALVASNITNVTNILNS